MTTIDGSIGQPTLADLEDSFSDIDTKGTTRYSFDTVSIPPNESTADNGCACAMQCIAASHGAQNNTVAR